jgi:O-antigen ligase
LSLAGWLGGLAMLALPLAFSTSMQSLFWSPKAAICLALGLAGLGYVISELVSRTADRATYAAAAFLTIALVSTAVAPYRALALFGLYRQGTGLLFIGSLVGMWAIGRATTLRDRSFIGKCLAISVGVSIVVSVIAARAEMPELGIQLYETRSMGLMGNPVHLATFLAGAAALVAWEARGDRGWRWAFGFMPITVALQLSGSRAGLLIAALIAAAVLARRPRTLAIAAATIALGVVVGTLLTPTHGTSSTARLAAGVSASGYASRVDNWLSALPAIAERPLLGWGPGSYAAGVTKRRTLGVARSEGADRIFTDAHNIVVETVTTTGVLGLIAGATWLGLALRGARGRWLAFVVGAGALHLLQLMSPGTTPLMFLAVGMTCDRDRALTRARAVLVPLGAAFVGLAVAARLLFGDFELRQGTLDYTLAQAHAANGALPMWSETSSTLAKINAFRAISHTDSDGFVTAHKWFVEGTVRAPWDPRSWIDLAAFERTQSMPKAARDHFARALRANPQSSIARVGIVNADLQLAVTPQDLRLLDDAAIRSASRAETASLQRLRAQVEAKLRG